MCVFSEQCALMDTLSLMWAMINARCVLGIIMSAILKELGVSVTKILLDSTVIVSIRMLDFSISDMCSTYDVLAHIDPLPKVLAHLRLRPKKASL